MVTSQAVQQALAGVIDPLLGQNLVDLGMVHSIRLGRHGSVVIRLTLPSPHWPAAEELIQGVRSALAGLPGVAAVDVQPIDDPVWTPYRLAPALKAPLGLPPHSPAAPYPLAAPSIGGRVARRLRRLVSR